MNWSKKKVLVTGADGFFGSHLVECLIKKGCKVRAFTYYNSRDNWGCLEFLDTKILRDIEVLSGDLKDIQVVRKAVKGYDVIFHLGALISIPYSYLNPQGVIETNIIGTLNILESIREYGAQKLVHTSTSEVYGRLYYVPIDEQHPLQARSPYAASKIAADKLVESYGYSFGLPITIIRPFNTFGPRQSAKAIIPTIITQVLSNNKIYLGDTTPARDFVYIDDTIKAFIKIAEIKQAEREVINIGTGRETPISQLAKLIIKQRPKKVKVISDPKRFRPKESEIKRLVADNTKATKILKWRPAFTLEEGLKETISWFEHNLRYYKPKRYNI